jgi:glycyl-tRNA synthetase beta chain
MLAKADLSTGLVSELSSLQGIIGAEYSRAAGKSDAVVNALAKQYKTPTEPIETGMDKVAGYLAIADHIDKLAGYLGLGMEPSGSSDPFGLRKSVTTLIRIAENWDGDLLSFSDFLVSAVEGYQAQGVELDQAKALSSLAAIFKGRYEALFDNYRHDVLSAAIPEDQRVACWPTHVIERMAQVDELKKNELFVQTAIRPINIVSAARRKGESIGDLSDLNLDQAGTPDARTLYESVFNSTGDVGSTDYFLSLVTPINTFFDNNMVMDEDPTRRYQRLTLANVVARMLLGVGDFTKLEG